MKRFQGIFAVLLMFYNETGGIDRAAMEHMTGHLIDNGVHGLLVLGSNGECPYLTRELQWEAVEIVVKASAGQVPVIVGINERGTEPTLEMVRHAEAAGADGLLAALHVFYPLDEADIYRHYENICGATSLPVLYYNFPANTGLRLASRSISRIAEIDGIIGAKETIPDVEEIQELVELTGEDFCCFTGMTLNLVAAMQAGACGAICPIPNLAPRQAVGLYEAMAAGESGRADELQAEILAYASLLASPAPHAMQKEALRLLGHPVGTKVKSPLPQLTPGQAEQVRNTLDGLGLL